MPAWIRKLFDHPSYVGETERALKNHLAEHRCPSSVSSPVATHSREEHHSIDWSKVKVLDQDSDWYSRGVREAINIRRISSTLNRDWGRHDLPPIISRGKEVLRHPRLWRHHNMADEGLVYTSRKLPRNLSAVSNSLNLSTNTQNLSLSLHIITGIQSFYRGRVNWMPWVF